MDQAGQQPHRRGLAGAIRAEEAVHDPSRHGKVEPGESHPRSVTLLETARGERQSPAICSTSSLPRSVSRHSTTRRSFSGCWRTTSCRRAMRSMVSEADARLTLIRSARVPMERGPSSRSRKSKRSWPEVIFDATQSGTCRERSSVMAVSTVSASSCSARQASLECVHRPALRTLGRCADRRRRPAPERALARGRPSRWPLTGRPAPAGPSSELP